MTKFKKSIQRLRNFRVFHRYLGITLATLLLVSAVTGMLLSLKKEVATIQPPTKQGVQQNLDKWKSLHELAEIGAMTFYQNYPDQKNNPIDRLDVRPSKGIVKILFEKGYWEVQIDGTTGEVKSIAQRHSDWIEQIHDGSIISEAFKLISMNFLGFGLLFLLTTGLWLWYGPKRLRWLKKNKIK